MFGAPDTPRRPTFSYRQPPARRPGVGDHVCVCGGYVGLIVDIQPGGMATVSKRAKSGSLDVEVELLVDTLTISPTTPIGFDEVQDRDWRRGSLG